MWEYEDIINAPRYVAVGRPAMSVEDRAAQFSAFAALTGFDGVIRETGRLTSDRAELEESVKSAINETLCALLEQVHEQPRVSLVWFRYDDRKAGGAYVSYRGKLKKLDEFNRALVFADGTRIPIEQLHFLGMEDA